MKGKKEASKKREEGSFQWRELKKELKRELKAGKH